MIPAILVLNAGSSSIKFGLYGATDLECLCNGSVGGLGQDATFSLNGAQSSLLQIQTQLSGTALHEEAMAWLLQGIETGSKHFQIVAVGHRVVHGGADFAAPLVIGADVLARLDALVELAPGHEPHNLAAIRAVAALWPALPQVACFDTGFHRSQSRLAQVFALPRTLTDQGILRYGFHGLSYEYIASVLPEIVGSRAEGKVIVAHLGNGASMCAMRNRKSVASTMGFTALDGLMMGTRSGAIDPGVVLHLLQARNMSSQAIADLLYNQSGLLGVSGVSSDVRRLETSDDPRAHEALDLFAYRAARELGSLVAALGGLDVLVFTAGIGEHSASMRQRICALSEWTGLILDGPANVANAKKISSSSSAVDAFVIPTNEELVLARSTLGLFHHSMA